MSYSWLKADQIDMASEIDLHMRRITLSWNEQSSDEPIPGKETSESYENRIHEVDVMGFYNPIYTVRGVFDVTQTTNADGSVLITVPRMASFMTLGSPMWFYDDSLITNPAGSCHVLPESCKVERRATAGSTIEYQMKLIETKGW